MNHLSLQIDGQWANLIEGTEIALEGNNPIFSDAGDKTYLFQLHVDSNRHLFGNSDDIFGESYYRAIEGKRAMLYVSGIPIMVGKVSLEDEVYVDDDGCIAINIVCNNLEFAQMIEGMNCRDVELLDDNLEVGYRYDSYTCDAPKNDEYTIEILPEEIFNPNFSFDFPYNFVSVRNTNISDPYPEKKYCNIRRAYSVDGSASKNHKEEWKSQVQYKKGIYSKGILSLEYGSMNSGLCFYVLYFIDCLAAKLNLQIKENCLLDIEDAKRLAFVNLYTKVEPTGETESITLDEAKKDLIGLTTIEFSSTTNYGVVNVPIFEFKNRRIHRSKVKATSENFPDASVSDVIDAIEKIFNVRFYLDALNSELSIKSTNETLKRTSVAQLNAFISEAIKVDNRVDGFRLFYSSDEEDLNFNFNNYSNVKRISSYSEALKKISSSEKSVFIDERTGNAYVIKVSEEAVDDETKQLNPSLFEVGGFSAAEYGDCSNENNIESVELKFNPIIVNDINGADNLFKAKLGIPDSELRNIYALAINEDIPNPSGVVCQERRDYPIGSIDSEYWLPEIFYKAYADVAIIYIYYLGEVSYTEENAISSYDTGLMFGIMRGPGSESTVVTSDENFDGEGNSRLFQTAANYAFTSDSVDNCNNDFDYNGNETGVVDYDGRFSLKLRAGKYDKDGNPVKDENGAYIMLGADRANRGLYEKFWQQYAYFAVNKKIVRLKLYMEVSELTNIDWSQRYQIGPYIGYVSSWSTSVNQDGIGVVDMDFYYL